MKIVLVRPNYKSHIITPPLGLGYLASYLKKHGIDAEIIDGLRDNLSITDLLKKILSKKPDAVGITCLTAFCNEVVKLAKMVKKNNIRCIIGGIHPTFLPYEMLESSNADYVVCGEGEIALLKLVKNNFINKGIQGVYSKEDLKSIKEPPQKAKIINNLDDIPFPDWKQINPNTYPEAPHGAIVKNFPLAQMITTRGCPYECTFCATPKFCDRKIRFRTPENVIQEIKYLIKNFGVKEIHFEDDNLTIKRSHIEKICDLLIDNNIKISWACPNGIRADKMDEGLIRLMKKSGCYFFAYGIESANPEILKNIKKDTTIDIIEKSIEIANRVGISCQGFFIFGLPGETPKTLEENISFAKKSKLSRAQFSILNILPGSELWDKLKGKFKPNWENQSFKEPEWIPKDLSKAELMEAQTRAFRQFYLRPIVFLKMVKLIKFKQLKYLFQRIREYRIIKI